MSVRTRVLEALLQSIAGDAASFGSLDLTLSGAAASAMRRADIQCSTAPMSGIAYGLVVCEAQALDRAARYLDPDGSILVFVAPSDSAEFQPRFELVARVRCPEGEWRLMQPAQNEAEAEPEPPAVSLIVTVQDQAPELARLIASLVQVDVEPSWELIVIDRGSFDATSELLRLVTGDVVPLRAARSTAHARALYLGMLRARGHLVAIIDPDLVPDRRMIAGLAQGAAQRPYSDVFAGPVFDGDGSSALEPAGPVRMLALRRGLLHANHRRSPAELAARLRAATTTFLPAFSACRRRPESAQQEPRRPPSPLAPDSLSPQLR